MELDLQRIFAQIAAVKEGDNNNNDIHSYSVKKRKREDDRKWTINKRPVDYKRKLDYSNEILMIRIYNGRKYHIVISAFNMGLNDFPVGFAEKEIKVIKSFKLMDRNGKYLLTTFNGLMKKRYPGAYVRSGTGYIIFTHDMIKTYEEFIQKTIDFYEGTRDAKIKELQGRIDSLEEQLGNTYQALTGAVLALSRRE